MNANSEHLSLVKNGSDLRQVPFRERRPPLLIFHSGQHFSMRLAERRLTRERQLAANCEGAPLIDQGVFIEGEGNPLRTGLATYTLHRDCETRAGTFTPAFQAAREKSQ